MMSVSCGNDEASRARDRLRRPDLLVAALGIRPGARVADVGAGDGYLTHRIAAAAGPGGRVVATDIDAAALARIAPSASGEAPVETRRVEPDDPGLEASAYDLILLSEVDQYLADRQGYFARLRGALAPGGRLAISNRRTYRDRVVEAAGRAGLALDGEYEKLPAHFLVLLK
jgi:predicted methyltransferase